MIEIQYLSEPGTADFPESIYDEWKATQESTEGNTRLFRTKAVIFKSEQLSTMFVSVPIEVLSDGKVVGCATGVTVEDDFVIADLVIDSAIPERLEIENGKLYARASCFFTKSNGYYLYTLEHIELSYNGFGLPPIGTIYE